MLETHQSVSDPKAKDKKWNHHDVRLRSSRVEHLLCVASPPSCDPAVRPLPH